MTSLAIPTPPRLLEDVHRALLRRRNIGASPAALVLLTFELRLLVIIKTVK